MDRKSSQARSQIDAMARLNHNKTSLLFAYLVEIQ